MKNYIYILISISLLFTACKEPNPIEPDTKVTINDKVDYEVIDLGDYGLELESINENIIKSNSELTTLILNNVFTTNTRIADKLKDIDFENSTLVFISGRSVAEFTNITLDSIYLESDGSVIVDYSVFRRIGISGQAFYPYLIVLIKNRTNANIRFNRRNITEGEVPQFDGFETIATDIQVDARRKWKTVFRSADEFNNWAAEYSAKDTEFISEVDFEKEIVISVGTGRFTSGDFGYLIRDIKQQGNRLVVNSVFSVINHAIDLNKPNNHFVKIKRTNLSIDFTPSFIINIINPNVGFYSEGPKLVNIQTDNETKASINKVSSLAELFSVMPPSDELTTNAEIDFEFFDLLVIKAATQNVRIANYEIRNIKRDNLGITGNVILYPNITGTSQKYDAYLVIKILKTNIPISKNFEVIIK